MEHESKMKPAMEVRDLYFAYGKTRVLKGVSLKIESGKITTIMGANGCGKSTLEYGQTVPYALTDTTFLCGFQTRFNFLNALGRLHGVHGIF